MNRTKISRWIYVLAAALAAAIGVTLLAGASYLLGGILVAVAILLVLYVLIVGRKVHK